jgi:hypothetical protein
MDLNLISIHLKIETESNLVLPLVIVALIPCVSVPGPCFSAAHTSPLSTTVGPLLASRRLPVRLGPSPTSSLRGAASDPPPFAHCSTLVPPLKSTDRRWADSPPPPLPSPIFSPIRPRCNPLFSPSPLVHRKRHASAAGFGADVTAGRPHR